MNKRMLAGLAIILAVAFGMEAEVSDWETDFAKASTNSSRSNLYMLLDFSGSDWCGWCMKLDEEVFRKNDFKKFAKTNLVCVLVDFPSQKAQSKKLKNRMTHWPRNTGSVVIQASSSCPLRESWLARPVIGKAARKNMSST